MSMFVNMAAKGSKAARVQIYNQNHRMVYFLCLRFLKNEKDAAEVTRKVFADFWDTLEAGADVRMQLVRMTAQQCKALLLERNANAFAPVGQVDAKMPAAKADADPEEMYLNYLLSKMDNLHGFIFILKSAAGLNNTEIGELFELDEIGVNKLMNEAEDLARQTVSSMKSRKDCPIQDYQHVVALLQHQLLHIDVPAALMAQILRDVETTAAPTPKAKRIAIVAACVVLLIAMVYPIVYYTLSRTGKTYASIEVDLSMLSLPDDLPDTGTIVVELDASVAPKTVANFTELAESGFYDGLTFHRVIYDFMIQGGSSTGDGRSDDGLEPIQGEFYMNGYANPLSHVRGVISMARLGNDMNSATSQFFIMHTNTYASSLDGQYAAFGWVIDGMDFVDMIAAYTYTTDANGTVPAEYQPKITKVTIHDSL